MNQSVLISKVKGSYNRSSILLLSWTFEVWYLHWLDHASLGSHIDFERLMNLSRVKPAILSSKRVLVVKPRTVQSTNYKIFITFHLEAVVDNATIYLKRALKGKFVKMFWSCVRIFSFWSFWDDYICEFRFLAGSFFV